MHPPDDALHVETGPSGLVPKAHAAAPFDGAHPLRSAPRTRQTGAQTPGNLLLSVATAASNGSMSANRQATCYKGESPMPGRRRGRDEEASPEPNVRRDQSSQRRDPRLNDPRLQPVVAARGIANPTPRRVVISWGRVTRLDVHGPGKSGVARCHCETGVVPAGGCCTSAWEFAPRTEGWRHVAARCRPRSAVKVGVTKRCIDRTRYSSAGWALGPQSPVLVSGRSHSGGPRDVAILALRCGLPV